MLCGRISGVLIPSEAQTNHNMAITIIERFNVSDTRDSRFNMPVLSRTEDTSFVHPEVSDSDVSTNIRTRSPDSHYLKNIHFKFNAQHDCHTGRCSVSTRRQTLQQERVEFEGDSRFLQHSDDHRYLINMHALHNAMLIRKALPRHLTAPVPYLTDRRSKHDELAKGLRVTGPQRRAETAAKTKATKAKNQQKKNVAGGRSAVDGEQTAVEGEQVMGKGERTMVEGERVPVGEPDQTQVAVSGDFRGEGDIAIESDEQRSQDREREAI